jgi:hypothetical protein
VKLNKQVTSRGGVNDLIVYYNEILAADKNTNEEILLAAKRVIRQQSMNINALELSMAT